MRSIAALMCLFTIMIPGLARAFDLTGVWRGSLYGSKIVADLAQKGNFMSGVVTVCGPFGGETVYHVQGAVFDNGHMYVLHGSGHVFEGDFSGPDAFDGVLTLVGGRKFSLRAERGALAGKASNAQDGGNAGSVLSAPDSSGSPGSPGSPGSMGTGGSGGSPGPDSQGDSPDKAA